MIELLIAIWKIGTVPAFLAAVWFFSKEPPQIAMRRNNDTQPQAAAVVLCAFVAAVVWPMIIVTSLAFAISYARKPFK